MLVCVCVWVGAAGQCATSDTFTDRIRGRMQARVGVCAWSCVQPDTASHTLSVFSISYHQVEQLVTEEVGQAIRLQEVECATHHPAANLIIYFINYFLQRGRKARSCLELISCNISQMERSKHLLRCQSSVQKIHKCIRKFFDKKLNVQACVHKNFGPKVNSQGAFWQQTSNHQA